MGTDRSVAVVGSGPAGLAAAWRLSESGRAVTIYESRARVGGRLRTERLAGVGVDVGVQLVSAGYTATRELAAGLGAEALLSTAPGRDALWRGGRSHELRYGSVASMAVSSALPATAKLRLVKYVPFLERHAGALDLNEPARAAAAGLDGESIGEWGERKLGSDFVELLAYPLLAAYYGVRPEETSAALFHALARAGMGVQVLASTGGMSALAERLAAGLRDRGVRFQLGAAVAGIEPEVPGVRVRLESGDGVGHAGAVVAVPAGVARDLVPDAALPRSVRERRTAVLAVALKRPVPGDWFGLSFPRTEAEGLKVAAICSQAAKGAGLVPEGMGAVAVIPAPSVAESWADAEPRWVLDEVLPVLDRAIPGVRSAIAEARLVRLDGWVPAPGHFERLAAGHADDGVPAGVALSGDYLVAPTVEGAVRSGLRAAERITRAGS